tara:strand:- start:162 stop:449 length:288 start_codon:yes stop_codon:yes gene_type:complete
MVRTILVNGVRRNMTDAEEAAEDAREKAWLDGAFDRALENLRDKRNHLLAETDYFALSDVTMSDDMKTYRQELRDITNGLTTKEEVEAVTFPTKP